MKILLLVLLLVLFGCDDACCKIESGITVKYENMMSKKIELDIKFLRYYHTVKIHCKGGFHSVQSWCDEDDLILDEQRIVEQQVQNDLLFLNNNK